MDLSAIEGYLAEAQAAIEALADPIEGWNDYDHLDLTDTTQEVVSGQRESLARRVAFLQTVMSQSQTLKQAITNLLADGHPTIPTIDVTPEVGAELDDQLRTQHAARETAQVVQPTTEVQGAISAERPTVRQEDQ